MDDTQQKIIDAAMTLVRDKGYVATTTKEIAKMAGVNECTLFRRFESKKDIVLQGMEQEKWRANVTPDIFQGIRWELRADLEMFMTEYMRRMTPDFVRLSIGLRAPQIYEQTAPIIMRVPQAFMDALNAYFRQMAEKKKLPDRDYEALTLLIFSSTFGFTFLNASFDQALVTVEREQYIQVAVETFVKALTV